MNDIRTKWNDRYASATAPNQVIDVLARNEHLLLHRTSAYGKSLDLACGLGANALKMAELGYDSYAWDISDAAIKKVQQFAQQKQLNIHSKRCDITQQELLAASFDVILVSRFLLREMIPAIIAALRPGGLIFYQTFVQDVVVNKEAERLKGASPGPKNNDFRLQTNELLKLFSTLTIRYYREEGTVGDSTKGFRNEAMLVAQK